MSIVRILTSYWSRRNRQFSGFDAKDRAEWAERLAEAKAIAEGRAAKRREQWAEHASSSAISSALDKSIQDELDHSPASIVK